MQPDRLSDEQLDELAAELAPRLPTGTHGDRVILPRRQFIAALGGTLGAGALMALGVDEATAQAAGQQGTAEEPNDMFAWDLDVQNGATFNGTDIEGVGSLSADEVNRGSYIVKAGLSENQPIADTETEKVAFDTVIFESQGISGLDDTANEFIAWEDGIYRLKFALWSDDWPSAGGGVDPNIYVNNSRFTRVQDNPSESQASVQGDLHLSLNADDAVHIELLNKTGTNIELEKFEDRTFAEFHRVAIAP